MTQRADGSPQAKARSAFRRALSITGYAVTVILLWAGLILFFVSMWSVDEFGPVTIAQAQGNLAGGEDAAPEIARKGWLFGLIIPTALVLFIVLMAALSFLGPGKRQARGILFLPSALAVLLVVPAGLAAANYAFDWVGWLQPKSTDVDIATEYVHPKLLEALPGDKNLILIYLESMDDAFGDDSLVEKNALAALQDATSGWAELDQYTQIPSSGSWTIAAMVASQCGFPLRTGDDVILHNDERDKAVAEFLPGATCLGDLLKDAGYATTYMGGASGGFAGKGAFLASHGFDRVMDRDYWEEQGETEISEWGLSDRRLFELAKDEVLALEAKPEPFALTLLTLDNHRPIHEYAYCPLQENMDPTLNAMTCQGSIVGGFVEFLQDEGILDDTVVIIMADHQMLESYQITEYREQLPDQGTHPVPLFNRMHVPGEKVSLNRERATQLDMFPTILEMLGGELRGGQAGLGVSLVSSAGSETFPGTTVDMTIPELKHLLDSDSSEFYDRMWGATQGQN